MHRVANKLIFAVWTFYALVTSAEAEEQAPTDPLVACVRDVTTHPQFAEIATKLALYDPNGITFAMLADKSLATPLEQRELREWFEKRDKCWADSLEYHQTHWPPEFVAMASEGSAEMQAIGLDLYERRITFGQANKKIQDDINAMRARLIPIIQRYQAEIAAQKAAEKAEAERKEQARAQAAAEQRAEYQAAAAEQQAERTRRLQLFMNFMSAQSALANQKMQTPVPKPTYNTNCYTAGNNTNCTTR